MDPSEHFLAWNNAALNVLVIKKVMDPEVTKCFKELTQWLVEVNRSNWFEAKFLEHQIVSLRP